MNYLVFDCVLNKSYITLVKGENIISKTIESDEKNYHSVYLVSEIQKIMQENSLSFKELDFIGTDIGPASFTGIRTGLCIAKTLASETDLPLVPISAVEILSCASENKLCTVFEDARRGNYIYYNPKTETEPKLILKSEAVELAKKCNMEIICDTNCYNYFLNEGIETINYETTDFPIGEILARLASEKFKSGADFPYTSVKPLYVQTPPVFQK
ncbi:tRNA (adenosine(37)-N6)-threonylcarbamoyltransferase complex dimerization subunit type 1 TsaB [bacterium]|nr:tRNA (adenosine(37)-N6)-threonylcarbamoyltransferase complex dimerization subunit type 1 TsaB [bacterium]